MINRLKQSLMRSPISWRLSARFRPDLEVARWPKPIAHDAPINGLRILVATGTTGNLNALAVDTVLVVALRKLGHDARMLSCRAALSACMLCELRQFKSASDFANSGPKHLCIGCARSADLVSSRFSIPMLNIDPLPQDNPADEFSEHHLAGAIRFFASDEKEVQAHPEVLTRYRTASQQTRILISEVFDRFDADVIICHHGIYVPGGDIVDVATRRKKRVVTWNPAYRQGCYIFSHGDTYHKTLMEPDFHLWKTRELTNPQREKLRAYLASREVGSTDWISFNDKTIAPTVHFEPKKTALALTNVIWDAQVHYDGRAFTSMVEWLTFTIDSFSKTPEFNLLIRIHPAESTGTVPSRRKMRDVIHSRYPQGLPKNIYIFDSDDDISTYQLMESASVALIYATKAGVELAARGIPTIVTGEAWIRGKGLTIDPNTPQEYEEALQKWRLNNLPEPSKAEAESYAYHFFFEKMLPIASIRPVSRYPLGRPNDLWTSQEWPYCDPGLMIVLEGIVNGTPFTIPSKT